MAYRPPTEDGTDADTEGMHMYEVERDEDAAVMPLVLCRSEGGPYDDAAFTSGWRLGSIAATLTAARVACDRRLDPPRRAPAG